MLDYITLTKVLLDGGCPLTEEQRTCIEAYEIHLAQKASALGVMPFGKYKGQLLLHAIQNDARYFKWIGKQSDLDPELKYNIELGLRMLLAQQQAQPLEETTA